MAILSAVPNIGDALCHDQCVTSVSTSVSLLAPGNSIGPNCTKFGPYIHFMVEI